MSMENEIKVVFAKYCPLLKESDDGNLVSTHFDTLIAKTSEGYCNHTGVPRVEKKEERVVVACDGCAELMQGFQKPLESSAKI